MHREQLRRGRPVLGQLHRAAVFIQMQWRAHSSWTKPGGARDRIRTYCSFGESLLTKRLEARLEALDASREQGFSAFKLRSRSTDFRDDVRMMEAVRKHVESYLDEKVRAGRKWGLVYPVLPARVA